MRWHYADPPLLWLYPATYAIHLAEELWVRPGFVQWMRSRGSSLSEGGFAVWNAAGLSLMIAGVWLAVHRPRHEWIAVALAIVVLLNTWLHLAASISARSYSPGLGSAFALWVPLGLLTLVRAWDQASRRQWWIGLAAATLIHLAILSVIRGRVF